METISKINEIRNIINEWKRQGLTIGFVPTMGCLHQGHLSLIEQAKNENDKVIVSIFVNPLQFRPNEDFSRYPRSLDKDLEGCRNFGADLVFTPSLNDLLPEKNLVYVDVDLLGNNLCGSSREGHFRGVCTIVAKLFNILTPDKSYFGEKDAQQLAIITRMAEDLNFNTKIVPCAIVRESDGLAMSSRNVYLTLEERQAATIISKSLSSAKSLLQKGKRDSLNIKSFIIDSIKTEPLANIDYVEIVDHSTLQFVDIIEKPILIAVAVYFGKTRLIDNLTYKEV
ncbi:MAG: pantoate--beta-alanine ligase [Fusobacteria bacterium]|nr:MAG: pantoate--beta-alanine ligase [Fusobacteriota bacterium]KAF0230171.1 MAG: pantoate--beta-alanine [Fusobacteriota bacterium]